MTGNGNNEEHAWEDEAELHMMDVCPLFTAPDSWYQDLVHYLQEGLLPEHWNSKQRIVFPLNQLHIRSLMEFYSGRIMMESFSYA